MISEAHNETYDVVVIGGGPMGLAAAWQASKRGQRVLLLERFNFFNQSGSSNDFVRMFRTMYSEDCIARLAAQSLPVWRNLEREAGTPLIWMTGLLNFGDPEYSHGPEGTLLDPIANLDRLGMPYRVLTAKQIMAEYPLKNLPDTFLGVFAPDNGCIDVPLLLRTLYRLASAYGTTMVSHARVLGLTVQPEGVEVEADVGGPRTFKARRAIVTAGAYTNDVLRGTGIKLDLQIWEMVYEYYATDPGPCGTLFPSMWFQFMEPTAGDPAKSNLFYGFPTVPWGPPNMARIAVDNAVNIISTPHDRQIVPAANDLSITAAFVAKHCVGVDDRPNFCGTCLQTNVHDNLFVLDFLPSSVGKGHKNVALFTAGWGMKFTPVIGQILCDLVLDGKTSYDISKFSITRPGVLQAIS